MQEQEFTECIEEECPTEDNSPDKYETEDQLFIVDDEGCDTQFVVCLNDGEVNVLSDEESMEDKADEVEEEAVEAHKLNLKKRRMSGKVG